jgi:DNA-binding winged helix-turn-helix (wHTH) protein
VVRLQIDNLIFDSSARQLWVNGTEVHVSTKAFDLLALLIERRPEAVSRAELHARLWPGTFVSASSLPSLVSEIRVAIDDRQRDPHLIRTVHAFGYALQSQDRATPNGAVAAESAPSGWLVGTAEIALFAGENVLGREGSGVTLLNSSTVSRRHARIVIEADGVTIEDLGSKNGTYVNDRRVDLATPIGDGDRLRVGTLVFTYRRSPAADSTQSVSSLSDVRRRS